MNIKKIPLLIILGLLILLVYFSYFHHAPESNDADYLYWGKMHIILSAFPAIIYFNGDTRKHIYPFIGFISLFQILAFGLPVFFLRVNSFQMNEMLNLESMRVSFWGLFCFYATFFIYYKYFFKNVKPFQPFGNKMNAMSYNAIVYSMLFVYVITVVFGISAIAQLATFTLYVYVGLSFYKLLRKKLTSWETALFIIVIAFEFVRRVTSGLIAELAMFVLFLSLIIMVEGSKKYLIAVFIFPFAIFYSQFSSVKDAYRKQVWFQNTEMTYEEKLDLISDLIEKEESKTLRYKDKEGKDNFLWRFSYPMAAFSLVLTKTPSEVPYWNGDSYVPLFTKFIPRVIWPSKPEENMGQRFGRMYKIIRSTSDSGTSINTPILAELYMNFGLFGFYLGMCLLGLFFIFLDKFFNNASVSYQNQIVNMSITFPLMIMESNFSLTYGNLILICVSLILISRSVSR